MTPLTDGELAKVSGGAEFDPAQSDGCTLAPNGYWKQACVDHDRRYFYGGTAADRKAADLQLYDDMRKLGVPKLGASAYYYAVRIGGSPYIPSPWKWGFGKGK